MNGGFHGAVGFVAANIAHFVRLSKFCQDFNRHRRDAHCLSVSENEVVAFDINHDRMRAVDFLRQNVL